MSGPGTASSRNRSATAHFALAGWHRPATIGRVKISVGTSGYNYPEWRGTFYPEKFCDRRRCWRTTPSGSRTVEINYTFYRMPTEKLLEGWAAGTPDDFTFTLKAPRRITHDAKLQRCEDTLQVFCRTAATLGPKLAVLLFQLPPKFKKDADVCEAFVELLPEGTRAAFEFRHASWLDAEVFDVLRAPQRRALRRRQREDEHAGRGRPPTTATSGCATKATSRPTSIEWASYHQGLAGRDGSFVYFKHEEQGLGPDFAQQIIARIGRQR